MARKETKTLLTGGTGSLGQAIMQLKVIPNILSPRRGELDITEPQSIRKFITYHHVGAVVHCAALARMRVCENDPIGAINTNIIGTANVVKEVIRYETTNHTTIRFIHVSTDGVYESTRGNYSEKDPTIPYNMYGWTKLGAETSVHLLRNFCIIRTRFFNPKKIKFQNAATDIFTSSIPIDKLAGAIGKLLTSDFIGTINIGDTKLSEYVRYKTYVPSIKPCSRKDIIKHQNFQLAKDASMNIQLWRMLQMSL
mgnify:FL=1